MKIICTLNLKGGCAKTTTAVSMAELLATGFKSKHGTVKPGKVLLFDNDKQGNARATEKRSCILRKGWGKVESFT